MTNTTAKQILYETIKKIEGAYAPTTIRAYSSNFESFIKYCDATGRCSLPATDETVSYYIKHLTQSKYKSASIRIAIAAIATIHKLNSFNDPIEKPIVKIEMRRMHRSLGRLSNQAYGITHTVLEKMIEATDESIRGLRNRALLRVAYDTMCRRSEIISLNIEDVVMTKLRGVTRHSIILRKSKTDQDSLGKYLHISNSTAKSIEEWLHKIGEDKGPIFRGITKKGEISSGLSEGQINRIYKSIANSAKLDQKTIDKISGHSMRVGAAQDLASSGASLPILMIMGRWSKSDTVMRYIEHINIFSARHP